jgi:hypothetical protein
MGCAVVVAALVFAGCGGGGGDDDGGLSGQEKLAVFQARGDIGDFCAAYETEPSELFDRSFESMLTAVRDLSRIYRENPNAEVEISIEKKKLTMEQVLQEQSRELRECGRDGRQQAGVLDAELQRN